MTKQEVPDISNLMGALANAAAQAGLKTGGKFERPAWWYGYSYPEAPYISPEQLISFTKTALFFNAMMQGEKVLDYEDERELTGSVEELAAGLIKEGLKPAYDASGGSYRKSTGLFFVNDTCGLFLEIKNLKATKLYINCVTTNKAILDKVIALFKQHVNMEDKRNVLHMLSSDARSTDLMEIGVLSEPLGRSNYSTAVLDNYDYVIKQFNSKKPAGRLLILNGLPGTGKTYIIRGLLSDLAGGTFLLLPPDMVADISKPQLIETISDAAKNKFSNGPLYLIIEDADAALLRRGADNMNLISTLLNLGDGLLGSAFDLRVIATTNANKLDIEPAIMRPGRLCSLINLDKLSSDHANELFIKLNPKKWEAYQKKVFPNKATWFTNAVTLADVYLSASE